MTDEPLQYLSPGHRVTSGLTKELLSLIRQQRHQAMRVVISTQGRVYYLLICRRVRHLTTAAVEYRAYGGPTRPPRSLRRRLAAPLLFPRLVGAHSEARIR